MNSNLSAEQVSILDHTANRAVGGFYCGGGPEMDHLVSLGLMVPAGGKSFVSDPYFRMTAAGREALREHKNKKPLTQAIKS